jgi:Putative adhesin
MRAKLLLSLLTVSLAGLTGCDIEDFGGWQRYSRDFHYNYPLNASGRVSVETFNGSIEISAWDQDTVDISGTKYGPSQEAADTLRIDADHTPASVFVHAVRSVERRNNQGAKFVVKVPRTAILERLTTTNGAIRTQDGIGPAHFRTTNGSIRVESFRGSLDAQTSNGPIDLIDVESDVTAHTTNGRVHAERLRGSLDAATSNGSVSGEIDRVDRDIRVSTSNGGVDLHFPSGLSQDVRARTSNGGITLHLPRQINARVVASTTNSSVHSEFDVTVQGGFSRNHLEGAIGSGGPLIDLSTTNGSIRLVKM